MDMLTDQDIKRIGVEVARVMKMVTKNYLHRNLRRRDRKIKTGGIKAAILA